MKSPNLPLVIGGLILAFAIILSIASFATGVNSTTKAQATSKTYIQKSEAALKNNNIQKAIMYAQEAIKANPNNKLAFICYQKAVAAQYNTSSQTQTTKPTTQTPKAQAAPQFGC